MWRDGTTPASPIPSEGAIWRFEGAEALSPSQVPSSATTAWAQWPQCWDTVHTRAGTRIGVFGSHHDDGGATQPRSMLLYGLPRPSAYLGSTAREIDSVVAPRPNCGQLEGPTPEAVPLLWSVHWAPCRQVWSAGVSRTDRSLRVASLGGESFGRAGRDWPQKWP